jgi:Transglycosylase SLT domain
MGMKILVAATTNKYAKAKARPPLSPVWGEGLGLGAPLPCAKLRNGTPSNGASIPRPLPHRGGRGEESVNLLLHFLVPAFVGVLVAVSPAQADVIDISPTGAISVYKGPTQFVGAAATPLTANQAATELAPQAAFAPNFPQQMHPVLVGYLNDAATRYNVDPGLVRAVAWQESRFRSDAISPKGAIGIMQLMPGTAAQLGVNPHDPRQNIEGGVAYLRTLLTQFNGDIKLSLAAYNAGPAAVQRYGGIPPFAETQLYVKSIAERIGLR